MLARPRFTEEPLEWISMASDQDIIQSTYEDALRQLYGKLFQGYAEAGGDAGQQRQAEQHFAAGLALARNSRERALALLA